MPDYTAADDYQCTDFCEDMEDNPNGGRPGYDLSEFSEFEDKPFIEYDQQIIWGPLNKIIKYWYLTDPEDESTEVCINLFVYPDSHKFLYENFRKLNTLMVFCHGTKLQDRDYRIKAFTEIINKVGITNA